MRTVALFLLLLVVPLRMLPQVRVDAGASTLMGQEGIGATYFANDKTYGVGLAEIDGRFLVGGYESEPFGNYLVTAGSQVVGYSTDSASISLPLVGLSFKPFERVRQAGQPTQQKRKLRVSAFAGAVSGFGAAPWSPTVLPEHIGAGVLAQYQTGGLVLSSLDAIAGGLRTATLGATYRRDHWRASAATGLYDNRTFLEAMGAYTVGGFNASGSHYSSFFPEISTGDTISVGEQYRVINVTGGVNESQSLGVKGLGENVGAGVVTSVFSATASYYRSTSTASALAGLGVTQFENYLVTERIGARYSLTEGVSNSSGRYSVNVGGSARVGRVDVALNHSIQMTPLGYIHVTNISASVRIHDTLISTQNNVDPVGRVKWTASETMYLQKRFEFASHEGGKHVMVAVCVDENGKPVRGCAVELVLSRKHKDVVYSNGHGELTYHAKVKTVTIVVLPEGLNEDFTVVGAPTELKDGVVGKIVVKRIP